MSTGTRQDESEDPRIDSGKNNKRGISSPNLSERQIYHYFLPWNFRRDEGHSGLMVYRLQTTIILVLVESVEDQ